MMMKRRREKFKRGFQVWPGKCFAGRGNFGGGCLGVICRQREVEKLFSSMSLADFRDKSGMVVPGFSFPCYIRFYPYQVLRKPAHRLLSLDHRCFCLDHSSLCQVHR